MSIEESGMQCEVKEGLKEDCEEDEDDDVGNGEAALEVVDLDSFVSSPL